MSEMPVRSGRGLMGTRTKIALGIAFVEGIIVWVGHDVSRWTVAAIAISFIVLYFAWGRKSSRRLVREVTWIGAASQSLALILVILAWVLKVLALVVAVAAAVLALLFLLGDRGKR